MSEFRGYLLAIIVAIASACSEPGPGGASFETSTGTLLPATPDVFAEGNSGSEYGYSGTFVGDYNGDGFDDYVVGYPEAIYSLGNAGGSYLLFLGTASGAITGAAQVHESPFNGDRLGDGLAAVGDVNGDGYDDFAQHDAYNDIIIQFGNRVGGVEQYVFQWVMNIADSRDLLMDSAGDVDGDGYDDFMIVLPPQGSVNGEVIVYPGSASGPDRQNFYAFGGPDYGRAAAGIGDRNGDGYDDVVVITATGAKLLVGGTNGLTEATWSPTDAVGTAIVPASVTGGDFDGDGFADIVLGVPDAGTNPVGKLYVFYGSATAQTDTADQVILATTDTERLGVAVSNAGDTNADGCDELVATSRVDAPAGDSRGSASLYLGSATGLATTHSWRFQGGRANAQLRAAEQHGDLNGDGRSDVLLRAPYDSLAPASLYPDGVIRIFYGNVPPTPVVAHDDQYVHELPGFDFRTYPSNGVLSNDIDPNGDPMTARLLTQPGYGTLTLNSDGSFTFDHEDTLGTVTFDYEVTDSDGFTDVGTVTIDLIPYNQTPQGNPDSYTINEDERLEVAAPGVLANDNDDGSGPLTAQLFSAGQNGAVVLDADGGFTYQPPPDFSGTFEFKYFPDDGHKVGFWEIATIEVLPVNDAPVLSCWGSTSLIEGQRFTAGCTASDVDDWVAPSLVSKPAWVDVSLDRTRRVFDVSGVAPAAGTTGELIVEAKDDEGATDQRRFNYEVVENQPPYFLNSVDPDGATVEITAGIELDYPVGVGDPDSDISTLTVRAEGLPEGARYEDGTRRFVYRPVDGGPERFDITLTVADEVSEVSRTITFEVVKLDRDNDGLTDDWERRHGLDPLSTDSDRDGLSDAEEVGDPDNPRDTDGDGDIDARDYDSDDDGIDDIDEERRDRDRDGIPAYRDADEPGEHDETVLPDASQDTDESPSSETSGGCATADGNAPFPVLMVIGFLFGAVRRRVGRMG